MGGGTVADGTDAIKDKDQDGQGNNCCSGERQERLLGAHRRVSYKLGHIMENASGTEMELRERRYQKRRLPLGRDFKLLPTNDSIAVYFYQKTRIFNGKLETSK